MNTPLTSFNKILYSYTFSIINAILLQSFRCITHYNNSFDYFILTLYIFFVIRKTSLYLNSKITESHENNLCAVLNFCTVHMSCAVYKWCTVHTSCAVHKWSTVHMLYAAPKWLIGAL